MDGLAEGESEGVGAPMVLPQGQGWGSFHSVTD